MRTLIVGDIHGCYIEFQELLATASIGDSDAIIALGNIVFDDISAYGEKRRIGYC